MNLSEVKDQILDLLKSKWAELQESSLYIQLKEKYDDLSPVVQKLIVALFVFMVVMFFMLPPWAWWDSSESYVSRFETRKALIRSVLQLKRDIGQAPQIPNGPTSSALKIQVNQVIQEMALNENQLKGVEEINISNDSSSALVPASVTQSGVQLIVWKLNLTQIVDLSYKLQKVNPSAKILSLDMTANSEDNHYFDAIYQIVSFSVPQAQLTGDE